MSYQSILFKTARLSSFSTKALYNQLLEYASSLYTQVL
jgi:hypothetical protein